ncbi:hypothetical protein POG22_21970 [Geitlerinema sp. CS-897]|nr:hypothetical protein [Geitlerinema sp. CS-897]
MLALPDAAQSQLRRLGERLKNRYSEAENPFDNPELVAAMVEEDTQQTDLPDVTDYNEIASQLARALQAQPQTTVNIEKIEKVGQVFNAPIHSQTNNITI